MDTNFCLKFITSEKYVLIVKKRNQTAALRKKKI
jgi:hypothetical protein